jgi:hypothetical protein
MPNFLGIDPGVKGSIAFLDTEDDAILFLPTPGVYMHPCEFREALVKFVTRRPLHAAAIEDVHSVHESSAKSNFSFGRNLGAIEALVKSVPEIPELHLFKPREWQAGIGAPTRKEVGGKKGDHKRAVGEIARELYPDAHIFGPRGGLMDGRSDALLIAHYLSIISEE